MASITPAHSRSVGQKDQQLQHHSGLSPLYKLEALAHCLILVSPPQHSFQEADSTFAVKEKK